MLNRKNRITRGLLTALPIVAVLAVAIIVVAINLPSHTGLSVTADESIQYKPRVPTDVSGFPIVMESTAT